MFQKPKGNSNTFSYLCLILIFNLTFRVSFQETTSNKLYKQYSCLSSIVYHIQLELMFRVSRLESHAAKGKNMKPRLTLYFNVDYVTILLYICPWWIITSQSYSQTHRFSVLFEKVNTWLRAHPQRKVISCESLELKLKDGGTSVNTTKSTYGVNGKYETTYVRFIR